MSLVLALICAALFRNPPAIGDQITSFEMHSSGAPYVYHPGRVTVMCFCAFWCDTWKTQLPRLTEASGALGGLQVDFLTISVDGRWSELGRKAAVGRSVGDLGSAVSKRLGIDRVPYTLLLDQEGVVRWASFGTFRSSELTREVRDLLARKSDGGTVYLTFDDFPGEQLNDQLLDQLRKLHVPATFFCICSKLAAQREVVRRAVVEGQQLEIHAWKHDEKLDLRDCISSLSSFGVSAGLVRGAGKSEISTISGDKIAIRTIDPYDYARPPKEEILRRILYGVRPGKNVIQLHAGVAATIDALPTIVARLKSRGYTFELLKSKTD